MAAETPPNFPEADPSKAPSGGAPTEMATEPPQQAAEEESTSLVDSPVFASLGKAVYEKEEPDTKLYRVPFLNASFSVLSFLLLFFTVWAIWQDYSREWKYFQFEWQDHQRKSFEQEIAEETARIKAKRDELDALLATFTSDLETDGSLADFQYLVDQVESTALLADRDQKFFKADMDSAKFVHNKEKEHVLFAAGGDTEAAKAEIAALEAEFKEKWTTGYEKLLALAEAAQTRADEAIAELDARKKKFSDTKSERDALVKELKLLEDNLDDVAANAKNAIRNTPLLDFFKPSAQIHKVVTADLTEPLNFVDVPRVDRCKSCHVNIDETDPKLSSLVIEDAPHEGRVFRSHPQLDLFVGATSPHPYQDFGCTICHYGDGHSLTFTTASHTPRNHEQAEEWEEKYHWHEMHHQDFPMIPMQFISSTCSKCHPHESRIPGARRWNLGRQLVEDYGCFGCHKIKGFEDYRKAGPSLRLIASKVDREFLYKWIRRPEHFRPSTRMPRFFDLDNSSGSIETIGFGGVKRAHDFERRNTIEALALATYLEQTSDRRADPLWKLPGGGTIAISATDAEQVARGRTYFKESGCLGCHSMEAEKDESGQTLPEFVQNDHGPDLSTIGSKVSAEWLLDWIVDPKKYFPETRMPRLRIEQDPGGPQKLADLVAYLLAKRNESFDSTSIPEIDAESRQILKDIAYDYQRRNTTRPKAEEAVLAYYKSSTDPGDVGSGDVAALTYVGEKLVQRYGCFGCHKGIKWSEKPEKGFDEAQPIGTELSKHGNKRVDRLDFGLWGHQPDGGHALEHTRIAWFKQKIQNTRIFDMLPVKKTDGDGHEFYAASDKRVEKTPEELLKMPLFPFYDDEEKVEAVVTFLTGLLGDPIPQQKTRILTGPDKVIEDGRRLARFVNCQGCHRIGADVVHRRLDELPRFSYEDQGAAKVPSELEKETWLAEEIALDAFKDPARKLDLPAMTFPKHTFLSQKFKYIIPEIDEEEAEYSLVEILDYYWTQVGRPPRDRVLRIHGYNEGKVRIAFEPPLFARRLARDPGLPADVLASPLEIQRALAPPLLRREGERVHGDWLFKFLRDIQDLRPWLNVNMPTYGFTEEDSRTLAEMFRALAEVPGPYEVFGEHDALPALVRQGAEIFRTATTEEQNMNPAPVRLGCDSCHPAGGKEPRNPDKKNWGPDLGLARDRLRPTWIRSWLVSPQSFMPGTKMPDVWMQIDAFGAKDAIPPEDRARILKLSPFLREFGVRPLTGREQWQEEMDSILQYLMHMSLIQPRTASATPGG